MVKSLSVSGSLLRLGLRTGPSKFFVNNSTGQWTFDCNTGHAAKLISTSNFGSEEIF